MLGSHKGAESHPDELIDKKVFVKNNCQVYQEKVISFDSDLNMFEASDGGLYYGHELFKTSKDARR